MRTWSIHTYLGYSKPPDIGDIVIFKVGDLTLEYIVDTTFLLIKKPVSCNDKVFNLLDIDKMAFCRKAYGYEPGSGEWPTFNNCDYPALHRTIRGLFEHLRDDNQAEQKSEYMAKKPKADPTEARKQRVITCMGELYDTRPLMRNDIIVFNLGDVELKYKIKDTHCQSLDDESNTKIFSYLGLDDYHIRILFEENFPYPPCNGSNFLERESWPEWDIDEDMEDGCLVDFITDLYSMIENQRREAPNNNLKQQNNGKAIKIERITPTIRKGQKRRGSPVSGKVCQITIGVGHLSNRKTTR